MQGLVHNVGEIDTQGNDLLHHSTLRVAGGVGMPQGGGSILKIHANPSKGQRSRSATVPASFIEVVPGWG